MNESQFEKNFVPAPEGELSQKERLERSAEEWLNKKWQEYLRKCDELIRENPVFSAKGREYSIENEVDFLVASVQTRKKLAEELLGEARELKDYWKEKIGAKLVAFYEKEEELMFSYAELISYYSELSQGVEKESPYLIEMRSIAQKKFLKWQENNE